MSTADGPALLPQHAQLLADSAISPEVATARGYRSATTRAELRRLGFAEPQRRVPALLLPIYNVHGEIALYQLRPDTPRIRRGKPVKYETLAGARMILDVPPPARPWLDDPKRPLFVTEGSRKADAAVSHGLCCVALLGVWNWRGTNEHGGKVAIPDWESIALSGRKVYIVFDSDVMEKREVHDALARLKAFLESRGAGVWVIYLPPAGGGKKTGLDDFLAGGRTLEDLLGLATRKLRKAPREEQRSELLVIDAGDLSLPRVTAHAWQAVVAANDPPSIFRVGTVLMRLERDEERRPALRLLNADRLRHHLARVAEWVHRNESETRGALPPLHVVADMLAGPEYPVPALTRIVNAPVLAPDGTLLMAPGYHRQGEVFYAPAPGLQIPSVPDAPTLEDIRRARALIVDEWLGDFPFVSDADRSHAVALFLLPFVRELIPGATPFHLIEKPTPGTGAGLLMRVLAWPALGHAPALMTEGCQEDEWRKRLTAKLLEGPSFLVIDNVRDRLASAALSSAITAPVWEDRLLGHTQMVRAKVRCAMAATGNNVSLSSEMVRRTIRIRLDAKVDRPWQRTNFKHADLTAWTAAHRGELIGAALTLIRAWQAAGAPPGDATLGEFEAWARFFAGVFMVVEIGGFLGNLAEFYDASDREGAEIRAFILAWWQAHKAVEVGVQELFQMATGGDIDLGLDAKTDRGQRTQLGRLLAGIKDRRFDLRDGFTVRVSPIGERHHVGRWCLDPEKSPPSPPGPRGPDVSEESEGDLEGDLKGGSPPGSPLQKDLANKTNSPAGDWGDFFRAPGEKSPERSTEGRWPADPCHICHGRRWWRSVHDGQVRCSTCYHPANPALVAAEWEGSA